MKKIIYTLLLSGLLIGCGDFLKPYSKAEYIPETVEAIQEMLIGNAYPTCVPAANATSDNVFNMYALLDPDIARSDYSFSSGGLFLLDEQYVDLLYSYSPELPERTKELKKESIYDSWTATYQKILGCNAALDYVDGVEGSRDAKNYIKAQAHALRGFYYLHLVNIYSPAYTNAPDGLGTVLKLESDMVNFTRTRSTVRETYAQIVSDFKKAEELYETLSDMKQFKPNYMTSLPMVQMLLSRTYLYMANWEEAAKYAEKVILDWGFSLIDLNAIAAPNNAISTTNFQYHNFNSYVSNSECIWPYGSSKSYTHTLTVDKLGLSQSGVNFYRYMFRASDELLESFVDGDLRKERYIIKERFRPDSKTPFIYTAMAKIPVDYDRNVGVGNHTYSCALRLSEAYLNRAEALAMMNENIDEVYSLVNTLNAKRFSSDKYTDMPTLTGDALIDYIRNQRRLELCLEAGHRFFDVRRWGLGFEKTHIRHGSEQKFTIAPNDLCLTLPLPMTAYELNPAVQQNPKGDIKVIMNY